MNVSQAQTEISNRGFDYLTADRQLFYLNQAKDTFEDFYPWPWLERTAQGTAPLTIADLKQVMYVQDTTNDTELLGLPVEQIAVNGADLTQTGQAVYWWLDGATVLSVWPVNTTATVAVRYIGESSELAAGSDTPLIPARYHGTWIDLAVIRAYLDSDNFVAAQGLKQIIDADLQQIASRYASRNRQNPVYQTIRVGAEDW